MAGPRRPWFSAALIGALLLSSARAEGPVADPPTPPIAAPALESYPGDMTLLVDATDVTRHIFTAHESLPVAGPGPLTLLLPKWLPGEHAPVGPIGQIAGLTIEAGGKRLEWLRDPVEMTAFHVIVPPGARRLEITLQRLALADEHDAASAMSSTMLALNWNALSLYPAGVAVSGITVRPSVLLPHGWQYAVALDGAQAVGDRVDFAAASYETLVDSPLYAGRWTRRLDLAPDQRVPVHLTAFADRDEDLDARPEQIQQHRALVQQADRLFGSRHFDHYDFLLQLNDHKADLGIEHHRSSENGYNAHYFTEWEAMFADHDLLAHEFVHSWNGKFRRPADLWNADYNQPMRGSLLWVYEGQTQYWGWVLAARAGLIGKAQLLDLLAAVGDSQQTQPGRQWRSLQDTTNSEMLALHGGRGYNNWVRGVDYYWEGALIWLDADTLIREKSGGDRSLDDFARAFFGIDPGSMTPVTYRFEDIVAALNQVQPYDWAGFLRHRLDRHDGGAPLDGLTRAGYRLVYDETPNSYLLAADYESKNVTLMSSLGLVIGHDGLVGEVGWGSPAFSAGVIPGAQIIAVNSYGYEGADQIKAAITAAAKPGAPPIELLIKADDRYRMVSLDYHDGPHTPRLEPIPGATPWLDRIIEPKP